MVGFDVYTSSVKKVSNADLIAAIDQQSEGIKIRKGIKITDDPNAPEVRITDEPLLPLEYADVRKKAKELMPEIKFNKDFNAAMAELKKDQKKCEVRYLDPKKKSGTKKEYYSEDAPEYVVDCYKSILKL